MRKQTHSDWLQVARLGRVRGGIQTLICPPPLIPQWDWPEKILSVLQLCTLPLMGLDPQSKGLRKNEGQRKEWVWGQFLKM